MRSNFIITDNLFWPIKTFTTYTYERPLKWVEIEAIRKWLEIVYSFLIYVIIIFVDISFEI